ncbi:MAG TPA: phosphopyruvate hydratase [Candidatus Micrarchaeota archaeon]|nr:phosphopyruvate hydratase [Candidatus Micrarchaeota archaeon]
MATIKSLKGYEILDSRGNPTVACKITSTDGKRAIFKVPSGASTGELEAIELRDWDKRRYGGKGVLKAVSNVNRILAPLADGISLATTQQEFDQLLIDEDGTPNKGRLGANAILAVSGAYARLQAEANGLELWQHMAGGNTSFPVPQFNVLNAGRHAETGFEIQETLVIPVGARNFAQAMEMGSGVWHALKVLLKKKGHSTGRGDEGGFVNPFTSLDATVHAVLEAIEKAGYAAGREIMLAFDPAFSEIFGKDLRQNEANPKDRHYHFGGRRYSPEDMAGFWSDAVKRYRIISLEDGMAQNDLEGWKLLTKEIGKTTQLVLDDYICTNPEIIKAAIREGIGNSSLIKLNQIGTVTETIRAMEISKNAGRSNIISHRSGETEDGFIGHFAMHPLADQIKAGSSGGERYAKYNALLMAEKDFGEEAKYRGMNAFPKDVEEYWLAPPKSRRLA